MIRRFCSAPHPPAIPPSKLNKELPCRETFPGRWARTAARRAG